jgi:hypothetical protein
MGATEVAAAKAAWGAYIEQRSRNSVLNGQPPLVSYVALRAATTALNVALDALSGPELASIQTEIN